MVGYLRNRSQSLHPLPTRGGIITELSSRASRPQFRTWPRFREFGLSESVSIGNESVPIQLAQCRFSGLAISNAKILIHFSNKIYGRNFVKQHSETDMVFEITKMLIAV